MKQYSVQWSGIRTTGFKSEEEAMRYIDRVCKTVAPDHDYRIIPIITTNEVNLT